jgi:hypothetical protein
MLTIIGTIAVAVLVVVLRMVMEKQQEYFDEKIEAMEKQLEEFKKRNGLD